MVIVWIPAPAQAWLHPDPVDLGLANIEQQTNYWCWASVTLQALSRNFLAQNLTQCQIVNTANAAKGQGTGIDCCRNPDDEACSRLADLEEMLALIRHFGGRADLVALPETPEDIYEILISGRPVLAGFERVPNANHIYLIQGIFWQGDEAMLKINDPATAAPRTISFKEAQPTWLVTVVAE